MNKARLIRALVIALAAHAAAAEVSGQQQPTARQPIRIVGPTTKQQDAPPKGPATTGPNGPRQATQPTAEIDLVRMSMRLNALAEQVEELRKQNQALASKVQQLTQAAQANAQTASALKQLDAAFRSHTHYMPEVGQMALSAVPGMQDIANKAGLGAVKAQWDTIKLLWKTGNGGLGVVGPPVPQQ